MRWYIKPRGEAWSSLEQQTSLSPVQRLLLSHLNIREEEEIQRFLNPQLNDLHDPFYFSAMEDAVSLIMDHLSAGDRVRIVGDYDQDGVAATAILVKGLRFFADELGLSGREVVDYIIPDRIEDGYGIRTSMIDEAKKEHVGLLITCDNGIRAMEEVIYAKRQGLDIIVTDHHQIAVEGDKELLPPADAILNPHSVSSGYPYPDLCGAGVAYKLIEGIALSIGYERQMMKNLLQFAALGTICDMVPLIGENRTIAKLGLEVLNEQPNLGIRALLKANRWEKPVDEYTVGFIIGPCINASGRLFTAKMGVELFLTDVEEHAQEYAQELVRLNQERKQMTRRGEQEAIEQVAQQPVGDFILLHLPSVHESICGLIAGRIKDKYHRPTLVLTDAEGEESACKGSGRSIPGVDITETLTEIANGLFERFGGHPMACGCTLPKENLKELQAVCAAWRMDEEHREPSLALDAPVRLPAIGVQIMDAIEQFAPFGTANPKPVFGDRSCNLRAIRLLGQNQNVVRMEVEKGGRFFSAISFGGEDILRPLHQFLGTEAYEAMLRGADPCCSIDIAYTPEWNEYNGTKRLQLRLIDYRVSDSHSRNA